MGMVSPSRALGPTRSQLRPCPLPSTSRISPVRLLSAQDKVLRSRVDFGFPARTCHGAVYLLPRLHQNVKTSNSRAVDRTCHTGQLIAYSGSRISLPSWLVIGLKFSLAAAIESGIRSVRQATTTLRPYDTVLGSSQCVRGCIGECGALTRI